MFLNRKFTVITNSWFYQNSSKHTVWPSSHLLPNTDCRQTNKHMVQCALTCQIMGQFFCVGLGPMFYLFEHMFWEKSKHQDSCYVYHKT